MLCNDLKSHKCTFFADDHYHNVDNAAVCYLLILCGAKLVNCYKHILGVSKIKILNYDNNIV